MRARLYVLAIVAFCSLLASAGRAAAIENVLQSGNSYVTIDDSPRANAQNQFGLYSWTVDGKERMYTQWFWYRVGPDGPEVSIDSLAPSDVAVTPDSVTRSYSLSSTFDLVITWSLAGGAKASNASTLAKTVKIVNKTASALDFHLFHYSDYDLDPLNNAVDNVAILDGAQSVQTNRKGVTLVQTATVPPSLHDVDSAGISLLPGLDDGAPTALSGFSGPWPVDDDMNFAFQWDLAVPANGSVSLGILDRLVPSYTPNISVAHGGGCVAYGGPATYTITYDNTANSVDLANAKILLPLPEEVQFVGATDGGLYDAATRVVTWSLGRLAAGTAPKSVQLTVTAASQVDFRVRGSIVSDDSFPGYAEDVTTLCNHPPFISSLPVTTATAGVPYLYQVNAGDQDKADTLTFSLLEAPAGMSIHSTAGVIGWIPSATQTGAASVTVQVSDGSLTARQSFSVMVKSGSSAFPIPDSPVPPTSSTPVTSGVPPIVVPATGDVDGSGGEPDITDALLALRIAVGLMTPTLEQRARGDVYPLTTSTTHPDGQVTVQDALLILRKALGLVRW